MEIIVRNNNELFKHAVLGIRFTGLESDSGNSEVNQDGTRYIDGVFVATVQDPTDRWLCVEGRNSSSIAAAAETLWVLAGRNDLNFLSRVLPRAVNFSDDGKTWRAAYGPRLYANGQLDSVINRLKANHNTRQAYLTIYDPALDSDQGLQASSLDGQAKTKDMVCNFALLFDIKNNKLNLTVTNRSQDVLWGMSSINFIEFSIIQEIIAKVVGVEVGVYRLVSNNLHYYNNEVSQKQLSKINHNTHVWYNHASPIILGPDINTQEDIQAFFYALTHYIENGRPFEDINDFLNEVGAGSGLIRDMAYVVWCRFTGNLINMNNVGDMGLVQSICRSSVDNKLADQKYQEGCPGLGV